MTFDMSQCKIGDKLKTRSGKKVILENIWENQDTYFPYVLDNEETVTEYGRCSRHYKTNDDTIGFWEEPPSEDNEETYPTIEVRTPYVTKDVTYRVHLNEMYHRDLTEEEAVAIYEQLKTLLNKEENNND